VYDNYCGLCIIVLYFLYLKLVKGALSVFDCTVNKDGEYILDADPAVKCGQVWLTGAVCECRTEESHMHTLLRMRWRWRLALLGLHQTTVSPTLHASFPRDMDIHLCMCECKCMYMYICAFPASCQR
jgi:hypothetical protein